MGRSALVARAPHPRWLVLIALGTAVLIAASTAGGAGATVQQSTHPVLLGSYSGLYSGDLGAAGDAQWVPVTDALHAWAGRGEAIEDVYSGTGDDPRQLVQSLTTMWTRTHAVPMLTWTVTYSDQQNAALAAGRYDPQLRSYAGYLQAFLAGPDGRYGTADDRRLYLRPDPEANGDWYPYSPAYGHPAVQEYRTRVAHFVAMWRHLVDVFRAAGLDRSHLAVVFSVDSEDAWQWNPVTRTGERITEQIFPGTSYADWVGVDGYNLGAANMTGWQTPDQVFDPMVARLTALAPSTPLGIDEVGTLAPPLATLDADRQKAQWIAAYFAWLTSSAARRVGMSLWFNCTDSEHHDFSVFGRTEGDQTFPWGGHRYVGFSSYRTATAASWLVDSSATNPRLLTDGQFLGTG